MVALSPCLPVHVSLRLQHVRTLVEGFGQTDGRDGRILLNAASQKTILSIISAQITSTKERVVDGQVQIQEPRLDHILLLNF